MGVGGGPKGRKGRVKGLGLGVGGGGRKSCD